MHQHLHLHASSPQQPKMLLRRVKVGNSYLCAIFWIYICPHFIPLHFESSKLIDRSHVADTVPFVVVLLRLFGAEGKAANSFEEDGGCFEHRGWYSEFFLPSQFDLDIN
jgi:hypothetical protein